MSVVTPFLHHTAPVSLSHNLPMTFLKEVQGLGEYLRTI